jgi:hypothetical protein
MINRIIALAKFLDLTVKETILETTGVPLETKSSQLAVKAQLNYYASDGTTGVFGTPQTIRVS